MMGTWSPRRKRIANMLFYGFAYGWIISFALMTLNGEESIFRRLPQGILIGMGWNLGCAVLLERFMQRRPEIHHHLRLYQALATLLLAALPAVMFLIGTIRLYTISDLSPQTYKNAMLFALVLLGSAMSFWYAHQATARWFDLYTTDKQKRAG